MSVKLLTEHNPEFLSLKGGCTGASESTPVKMLHWWKSHVVAHISIPKHSGKPDTLCWYIQEWAYMFEKQTSWNVCDINEESILLTHLREMYKIWNICNILYTSHGGTPFSRLVLSRHCCNCRLFHLSDHMGISVAENYHQQSGVIQAVPSFVLFQYLLVYLILGLGWNGALVGENRLCNPPCDMPIRCGLSNAVFRLIRCTYGCVYKLTMPSFRMCQYFHVDLSKYQLASDNAWWPVLCLP